MPFFKLGNTHVPHCKNTAHAPAVRMPAPDEVLLPMAQHIGAPATLCVNPGDHVDVGQKIAEAGGFVSSPIYASVSGTVGKTEMLMRADGRAVPAVRITSDGNMTPFAGLEVPAPTDLQGFIDAVRASGLVGLGGAGFPTAVKLEAEKKGQLTTVLINGAECEPYITSDTLTMFYDADDVYEGILLLRKFLSAKEYYVGIEKNKPECIEKLREKFKGGEATVFPLPDTYPQGGEKILIYNITGRAVPEGKLPADVGCLVMNVTSLAFLARYFRTGMPLVEKCVTVDGSAVKEPKNVICPIGTPIEKVIEFAGGLSEPAGKVLYGGPMMGISVYALTDPILKTTNAVTVLNKKDARTAESMPCIHCGRCVAHCPMGLNPTLFAKAMALSDPADRAARLEDAKIGLCIECGCCSFSCPSARPLVQTNRMAKATLREYKSHQQSLK